MRLDRELEGCFVKATSESSSTAVDTLAEADGVMFLCPACYEKNKGPVGTHIVICWKTGVDPSRTPKPGRWNFSGTGLSDLTFVPPGSTSVQLSGGCSWHGHVKNGEVTILR